MIDNAELRRLAEEVIRIEQNEDEPISAANPTTILALLDEIDRLKAENEVLRGALKQFAEMLKSINVPIELDEVLKGAKP